MTSSGATTLTAGRRLGLRAIRATGGTRAILGAGLLGGIATTSGVALTATSGWLIVRASQRPPILLLLTAIVAVRAFGMARPAFRYWERLRSHDAAIAARDPTKKSGTQSGNRLLARAQSKDRR